MDIDVRSGISQSSQRRRLRKGKMTAKYYFGSLASATLSMGAATTVIVARYDGDNPRNALSPLMHFAYGPYYTKKLAIDKSRYQYSYIKRFYFVNCTYPKSLKEDM